MQMNELRIYFCCSVLSAALLTSGSCSPLSRTSRRWRPLSLWDCSSWHSRSPRVRRRTPNLSSIFSLWRAFPEPGPPGNSSKRTLNCVYKYFSGVSRLQRWLKEGNKSNPFWNLFLCNTVKTPVLMVFRIFKVGSAVSRPVHHLSAAKHWE